MYEFKSLNSLYASSLAAVTAASNEEFTASLKKDHQEPDGII